VPSESLAVWVSANFLAYRVGLWTLGWHHSSEFLFDPLGFSLEATDAVTSLLVVVLLIGGGFALSIELRRAQTSEFIKLSCPACGNHIKFANQNLGQKVPCPQGQKTITLRKPDLLKMSCFFCQGHIDFPPHAIGKKMHCPHCNQDITLKEPA